jgi:hypothetical protein
MKGSLFAFSVCVLVLVGILIRNWNDKALPKRALWLLCALQKNKTNFARVCIISSGLLLLVLTLCLPTVSPVQIQANSVFTGNNLTTSTLQATRVAAVQSDFSQIPAGINSTTTWRAYQHLGSGFEMRRDYEVHLKAQYNQLSDPTSHAQMVLIAHTQNNPNSGCSQIYGPISFGVPPIGTPQDYVATFNNVNLDACGGQSTGYLTVYMGVSCGSRLDLNCGNDDDHIGLLGSSDINSYPFAESGYCNVFGGQVGIPNGFCNDGNVKQAFFLVGPPSPKGTIFVTTNHSAATFTITGPANYSGSGTSFSQGSAPVGTYTITYHAIAGFATPPAETKTLVDGGSISFSGTYILQATRVAAIQSDSSQIPAGINGPTSWRAYQHLGSGFAVPNTYEIHLKAQYNSLSDPSNHAQMVLFAHNRNNPNDRNGCMNVYGPVSFDIPPLGIPKEYVATFNNVQACDGQPATYLTVYMGVSCGSCLDLNCGNDDDHIGLLGSSDINSYPFSESGYCNVFGGQVDIPNGFCNDANVKQAFFLVNPNHLPCTSPTIVIQPVSQTIIMGETATLSVVASGSSPLFYQWFQGNMGNTSNPITGATSSSYTTPSFTSTHNYWVRVSNTCGSVDSVTMTVAVSGLELSATSEGNSAAETTPITQAVTEARFPLGSAFSFQLWKINQDETRTAVPSLFTLRSHSLIPSVPLTALFKNNVIIEFAPSRVDSIKFFQAVHLGESILDIIPSDTSITPVRVRIIINEPLRLGSSQNQFDPRLISLGNQRGIPPQMLKGQARKESGPNFNPQAYRYEPLSVDFAYISRGKDLRTSQPYSFYRLATTDGLLQGTNINMDDISPRSIYCISRNDVLRRIDNSDQFVSAREIYLQNDKTTSCSGNQNWSINSAKKADLVAKNPALLDFTAQTSLAASYGLLQILYSTAVETMDWQGINGAHNPNLLFDTDANLRLGGGSLGLGSGYLVIVFPRANSKVSLMNPTFSNQASLEDAFRAAFNYYNHSSPEGDYGREVLNFSLRFKPVSPTGIFR